MTLYFAYGSNMDPSHMTEKCPGATRLGTAALAGHSFRMAATGYGNAGADPGAQLPGVLWELDPPDEAALDAYEGVPQGLYRKDFARVTRSDGAAVRAMLYRATDPAPGPPVPGYLERIIEVAESLEFPSEYVASLRRLVRAG